VALFAIGCGPNPNRMRNLCSTWLWVEPTVKHPSQKCLLYDVFFTRPLHFCINFRMLSWECLHLLSIVSMKSSSSQSYDVFPNFRGEDVRHSLVSHLRKELDRKFINTFNDNRIERSRKITPELLLAIENQGSHLSSSLKTMLLPRGA